MSSRVTLVVFFRRKFMTRRVDTFLLRGRFNKTGRRPLCSRWVRWGRPPHFLVTPPPLTTGRPLHLLPRERRATGKLGETTGVVRLPPASGKLRARIAIFGMANTMRSTWCFVIGRYACCRCRLGSKAEQERSTENKCLNWFMTRSSPPCQKKRYSLSVSQLGADLKMGAIAQPKTYESSFIQHDLTIQKTTFAI